MNAFVSTRVIAWLGCWMLVIGLASPAVGLAAVLAGPVLTGACAMGAASVAPCTASAGGATQTVNLLAVVGGRAVNPARTFVVCQNRTGTSDRSNRVTCNLTGATTLVIQSSAANAGNTVRWYAVEFYSGVQVQRNVATLGNGVLTLPVTLPTAINPGKTFVLTTERIANAGGAQNQDERWTTTAQLTTANNLQLTRNEASVGGDPLTVAWQVIQMDFASVQSGLSTIIAGQTAVAATISAVDPAKTFLVLTRRAAAAVAGIEGRYQVRGELTNGTTLTFTRAQNTNAVDISWFAVSLKGGNSVQRSPAGGSLPGGAATLNVAIPNAITVTPTLQSVPFISVSGGDNASSADLDGTSWTAALTSNTNLQLQRAGNVAATTSIAWFVVDFNRVTTIADWIEVFP